GKSLDFVEPLDPRERFGGSVVSQLERFVEAPTHVHQAAQATFGRDKWTEFLTGWGANGRAVPFVIVALNRGFDDLDPRRYLRGLPGFGERVGNERRRAAKAPEVAAVRAGSFALVENLQRRVVQRYIGWVSENARERSLCHRAQQVGHRSEERRVGKERSEH